jgi:hypothetical protein
MGLVGLVKTIRSFSFNQHQNGKKDDSTFDSNDLYDIVSLMETKGGDIEQALSKPKVPELDESMEVELPIAWAPSDKMLQDNERAVITDNNRADLSTSVETAPLINLGIINIEPESVCNECYEIEPAYDSLKIGSTDEDALRDPMSRHPIEEIVVTMPLGEFRSKLCKHETVKVPESNTKEKADVPLQDLTQDALRQVFMEVLKKISQEHMNETDNESYFTADILGDESVTISSEGNETTIGGPYGRLSVIENLVSTITTSVCGHPASTATLAPETASEVIARAVLDRERNIDMIVSQLQWEDTRRRQLVDDDSTISTRSSMQREFDRHY